jgi:hypothetical protein
MANLTVNQPSIKVLKAEIFHGIDVQRSSNGPKDNYIETKSTLFGAPCTYYVPTPDRDTRHWLDFMEEDYKPYLVSITALIESPMKLYIQN